MLKRSENRNHWYLHLKQNNLISAFGCCDKLQIIQDMEDMKILFLLKSGARQWGKWSRYSWREAD